ncbi:O-antigen ligase family protein [Brunnivagina elsteri]|uniref:O-antigen ligase-related domain-containing protein n=1 Tax=Brunnivagina elsteri CCALA 953 TaxID=987040 RepID=A0A2A2TNN7_9CYAN|nr:O-antigen ligase family protein [Calothrix elsteri]PAX60060.1 hypothetical protein CK510_03850 [Calothrix elsteri CCALA 953]
MLKTEKYFLDNIYLRLILLLVGLSSIVFIEPAPTDILVIFAFLWGLFSFFENPSKLAVPAFFLFSYIIFNLLASFALVDVVRGIISLTTKFYLILSWWLFIEIWRKFERKGILTIFYGYTFASLFAVILGICGLFRIIPIDFIVYGNYRLQVLFKDPNVFGSFLIPVTLYSLLNFESSKNLLRLKWLFVFITTSLGTFLSFSRASWFNYIVSLSVYILLNFATSGSLKIRLRRFLSYGFIAFIFILILAILLRTQPEIADFFTQRFSYQSYDNDRFESQEMGLDYFTNNPFIGVGPGQFEIVYPISSHSLYIRLFVETSFLGFISFMSFILITLSRSFHYALKSNYEHQKLFIIFTSSIIGILMNSLVIDTIHWRHFWLLLALPWGNYSNSQKQSRTN